MDGQRVMVWWRGLGEGWARERALGMSVCGGGGSGLACPVLMVVLLESAVLWSCLRGAVLC